MSKEQNSAKNTASKATSKDDVRLKASSSEATIKNERMFGSLEELLTYIGSSYPHYRRTLLPIAIVYFFLFFATRFLDETNKLTSPEVAEKNGTNEYFYSKCLQNNQDDLLKVAEIADFTKIKIPNGQLTIATNALFMFATSTMSPRKLILLSLGVISVSYFVMAHFPSQLQMSIFVTMVFSEVFRIVIVVISLESVPKFHRLFALIILEFVQTSSRTLSTLFVRLPSEKNSIDMSYSFEVFGFVTIIMGFVAYYTIHDSLYNLLARSKTDQMQDRLTAIFDKSDIPLAPDAVIDQIAFENFENNENPIEILVKTLKTFKLIQEVLICGLISGACLAVNAFAESEINRHAEVMFFEKTLIPGVTFTLSGVILIILGVLMPKKRILPVILTIPILFVLASAVFVIPAFFKTLDECSQHWIVTSSAFPFYLSIGVLTSALTDVIRFYVKVHVLEVMPALIRAPIFAILHFVQWSFDGNVRGYYATNSIGGETILILVSVVSMLVFLIPPRKKNEMTLFFSEYNNNDQKKKIPPAPEFVN